MGVIMNLGEWLDSHEMETNELARILGVTRQVIWKIKKGMTCKPETAQKIYFLTGGAVKPEGVPQGRVKGSKNKSKG